MPNYLPRRIVTAVDFGPASGAAVVLAGRLAAHVGATLVAVHAETLDVPPYFTHDQFAQLEREMRASRQAAEESVRAFVAERTTVPAEVRVVPGSAIEAVLGAAPDADLVVMGTHGRHGPSRWWLGSVAERVVRQSPVPVLVVHAPTSATDYVPRNVVVAGGLAAAGADTLAWADIMRAAFEAVVHDGPAIDQCDVLDAGASPLVIVGLPAHPPSRSVHEALVTLARNCPVPVLFVPAAAAAGTTIHREVPVGA